MKALEQAAEIHPCPETSLDLGARAGQAALDRDQEVREVREDRAAWALSSLPRLDPEDVADQEVREDQEALDLDREEEAEDREVRAALPPCPEALLEAEAREQSSFSQFHPDLEVEVEVAGLSQQAEVEAALPHPRAEAEAALLGANQPGLDPWPGAQEVLGALEVLEVLEASADPEALEALPNQSAAEAEAHLPASAEAGEPLQRWAA